jgi:hypothetical protein
VETERRPQERSLPQSPHPIVGLPEPLRVHSDVDAAALDEMLDRLLRAETLPPPSAARN